MSQGLRAWLNHGHVCCGWAFTVTAGATAYRTSMMLLSDRWCLLLLLGDLQLPAGVLEQGETVEELAVRELQEETGGQDSSPPPLPQQVPTTPH
jgi:hypothetical protein